MIKTQNKHHGGDIGWATNHFGEHPKSWIDLSTGINPNQYPVEIDPKYDFNSLPSKSRLDACLLAAKQYYKCESTQNVLLAPGSQILINQLPYIFESKTVNILSPTYGEHAPAWENAGHEVSHITDIDDASAYILLIVNPNNPDGKLYNPIDLLKIAHEQNKKGGYLIIDEAFIDIQADMSCAQYAGIGSLIILRSFGKFFGLGGIRLGALLAPVPICEKLKSRVGPWAVSSIALTITTKAYLDNSWTVQQIKELSRSSKKLDRLLVKIGCEVVGGTDLYRLVSHTHASNLFKHLGQDGIYVRHFEYNAKWLRFGLLSETDNEGWHRLEESLNSFIV